MEFEKPYPDEPLEPLNFYDDPGSDGFNYDDYREAIFDEILERMSLTDSWRLDEHGRDVERIISELRVELR